jgi:hypothetical protein
MSEKFLRGRKTVNNQSINIPGVVPQMFVSSFYTPLTGNILLSPKLLRSPPITHRYTPVKFPGNDPPFAHYMKLLWSQNKKKFA